MAAPLPAEETAEFLNTGPAGSALSCLGAFGFIGFMKKTVDNQTIL